eukprot:TRINITY_DN2268_c0_g1_i4.p1 TRINITY_DN2268_c0_g1~~TRINITY_DN2268_c0_g1_i4.p1  ORF type:complete len:533 (-),score=189.07 TRINITY_DN2268_c0_g1_i4:141-1565(-)
MLLTCALEKYAEYHAQRAQLSALRHRVVVNVTLSVVEATMIVKEVKYLSGNFTADITLVLSWSEVDAVQRLAHCTQQEGWGDGGDGGCACRKEKEMAIDVHKILHLVPTLSFVNETEKTTLLVETATLSTSGTVKYTANFTGTFREEMELKRFPFDSQLLHVTFQHKKQEQSFLRVTWDEGMSPSFKYLCQDGEWDAPTNVPSPLTIEKEVGPNFLQLIGRVQRKPTFFFWNVIFMVFLIVSISFVTFVLPPDDGGTRLSFNITLLLTAVSYKNTVCGFLPKNNYLTLMDYYILSSFVVLAALLVENAVALAVGPPIDAQLDQYTEGIIISVWCLYNVVITVSFALVDHLPFVRGTWSQIEKAQQETQTIRLPSQLSVLHWPKKKAAPADSPPSGCCRCCRPSPTASTKPAATAAAPAAAITPTTSTATGAVTAGEVAPAAVAVTVGEVAPVAVAVTAGTAASRKGKAPQDGEV